MKTPRTIGRSGPVIGLQLAICALLTSTVLSSGACAKAPPSLSPAGVTAFHARQVVQVIGVLQTAAIEANATDPPLLPDRETRRVVTFCVEAAQIVKVAPSGLKPVLLASVDALRRDLAPATVAKLQPYFTLLIALLGAM